MYKLFTIHFLLLLAIYDLYYRKLYHAFFLIITNFLIKILFYYFIQYKLS